MRDRVLAARVFLDALGSERSGCDLRKRYLVPDEVISLNELRRISVPIYGMERWGDLFSPRQALAMTTLARLVRQPAARCGQESSSPPRH